jgi:hypothetical protein
MSELLTTFKIISFTGSRKGLTERQIQTLSNTIQGLQKNSHLKLEHGDCIGADADAHMIALMYHVDVLKRPCYIENQRAFTEGGTILAEPEAPLDRNHKIVDDGEQLIACPGGHTEELRSGTWATVRYARRNKKPIIIIWPDGSETIELAKEEDNDK